jgi:hypothetical protein
MSLEQLLMLGAADPDLARRIEQDAAAAARSAGVTLLPSELRALAALGPGRLPRMLDAVRSARGRRAFIGGAAATVALLGACDRGERKVNRGGRGTFHTLGIRAELSPRRRLVVTLERTGRGKELTLSSERLAHLREHLPELRRCYLARFGDNTSHVPLAVALRLEIEPDGEVRRAKAAVRALRQELFQPFVPCVERVAGGWRFPPGRRQRVEVPVFFNIERDQ